MLSFVPFIHHIKNDNVQNSLSVELWQLKHDPPPSTVETPQWLCTNIELYHNTSCPIWSSPDNQHHSPNQHIYTLT